MNVTTRCGPSPQEGASLSVARRVSLLLADIRLAGVRLLTTDRSYTVEFRGRSKFCADLDAVLAELVRLKGGAS